MKSSSTQLLPSTPDIQDILETAYRNKSLLKLLLFQCQVSSFLQEFCPQLNSDNALCNEIFVEGFQVSAAKISEYQSLLKLYLGDISRRRKSDLTSKIIDISKQLDMLKNKMLKASDIKLDLKKEQCICQYQQPKKFPFYVKLLQRHLKSETKYRIVSQFINLGNIWQSKASVRIKIEIP